MVGQPGEGDEEAAQVGLPAGPRGGDAADQELQFFREKKLLQEILVLAGSSAWSLRRVLGAEVGEVGELAVTAHFSECSWVWVVSTCTSCSKNKRRQKGKSGRE